MRRELVAALLSLIVQEVGVDESAGHLGEGTNHRTGPGQVGEKDSQC